MISNARRTVSVPFIGHACKNISRHQSVNCMKVRTIYMSPCFRRLFVQQYCVDMMSLSSPHHVLQSTVDERTTHTYMLFAVIRKIPCMKTFAIKPMFLPNPVKDFGTSP